VAIHPGDILAGYRVTRLLGRGGMGEVWGATSDAGTSPAPHRDVAIKVLLARAAMKPDLVRRFEREAKIASAIDSPYVCQLVEVAEADDGSHLLIFEQLTGESLADRLKREQYLPFSEVGPIIEDVLRGLVAAHAAGVIHRDLKPGNIFLQQAPQPSPDAYAPPSGGFGFGAAQQAPPERRERAKILDFGISKLTGREGQKEPTLTAFDATLGSFAYMAPEQVRGAARADERADIYAVGAVAFRALSGRLPFEGTTAAVLVAMKLDRQAPSLAEATGEHWPAGVERFLERALDRRRELRFATAAEALEVWRSIQPSAIAYVPPERAPSAMPEPPAAPAPSHHRVKPPIPAPTKPVFTSTPTTPAGLVPPRRETVKMDRASSPALPGPTFGAAVIPTPAPAPVVNTPPVTAPPPARPPMQSYQVIEDNPTEVDGPPEMTVDGSYNPELHADRWSAAAREAARRRKAGRP
jgi:serine/threonine-protein kinase